MNRTLIALMGSATLVLAGCAGAPPKDLASLEAKIMRVESGNFGTCMAEAHRAGVQLEEAKQALESMKAGNVPSAHNYNLSNKAADKAAEHRRQAEDACNRIWQPMEDQIATLESDVSDVDERVVKLERMREVLRGVTFHTGSAMLTTQAKTVLKVVADKLLGVPGPVEIAGYTSSTGTPEFNLRLSQRRADAVRNFLIQQGVNPANLAAKGFGMANPVASNDTPEGRLANQRVELHPLGR